MPRQRSLKSELFQYHCTFSVDCNSRTSPGPSSRQSPKADPSNTSTVSSRASRKQCLFTCVRWFATNPPSLLVSNSRVTPSVPLSHPITSMSSRMEKSGLSNRTSTYPFLSISLKQRDIEDSRMFTASNPSTPKWTWCLLTERW